MEPFSVTCPACQGKLIVKSEKLLGRTVPCPRCQSGVSIPNPQRYTFSPPRGPADSHAITKVVDDQWMADIDSALEAHQKESQNPSVALADTPRFRDEDELKLAPVETAPNLEVASILSQASTTTDSLTNHPQNWNPPATQKSRQVLLISTLGVGGLLVSIGLFYMFLQIAKKNSSVARQNDDTQVVAGDSSKATTEPSEARPDAGATDRSSDADQANSSGNRVDNGGTDVTEMGQPTAGDPNGDDPSEDDPSEGSTVPEGATSGSSNGSLVVSSDPNATEPANNPSATSPVPMLEPKDGRGLRSDSTNFSGGSTSSPSAVIADRNTIPDELKKYLKGDVFNGQTLPDAAMQTESIDVAEQPEVIELSEQIHPGPAPYPKPGMLDVPLGKIKINDKPLIDVLHLLSSLSATGIGTDYESMVAAGIDRGALVTVEMESATIEKVLQSIAEGTSMHVQVVRDGIVLLKATDEAIAERLPTDWAFDDLESKPESVNLWGDYLKEILPELRELAEVEQGRIVWQPTATPIQKARVAIALERIRVACGLPRKAGYLASDVQKGLGFEGMLDKLSTPGIKVVVQEQPVIRTMEQITRNADVGLIVDWPRVWTHGFTPTLARLNLQRNRTITQVFSYYLDRHAMELTIVDSALLRLTIPETRRLDSQLRVVPITPTQSVDVWREKLRTLSPTDSNRVSQFLVSPLPDRPFAVVRICPPTIQQAKAILGQ